MSQRGLALTALAAGIVAIGAAIGVAVTDGPHLTLDRIDAWLAAYAIGLGVFLGALPFAFHRKATERVADPERRWEWALTAWGAVALAAMVLFLFIGLASSFDAASAAGALAIVGCFECGLILAGLIALVLGT